MYQISSHPAIQRVVVLGTLCAVELRVEGSNAGYDLITPSFIFYVVPTMHICYLDFIIHVIPLKSTS